MVPLVAEKALAFATKAHAGVVRNYTGEPYIEHPKRVAATLAALGFPEEVIAAAYLHDVVEDTATTNAEIEALFGAKVAELVAEVTDPKLETVPGNRPIRFSAYLAHAAATSEYGAAIKLADMLDNSSNLAVASPSFAKRYLGEMRKKVAVLNHGHPELLAKLRNRLASLP